MEHCQTHIFNARRFEELNNILQQNLPKANFDHKVNALFYAALHYMHALAAMRNIDIGESHKETSINCNPDLPFGKMPIEKKAWNCYTKLRGYSWQARYNAKRFI